MKKNVLLIIVLVFCVNYLHAQSGKWADIKLNGENEQLLEGTTWLFTGSNENITITIEFRAGGRLVSRTKSSVLGDFTNITTWSREGEIVKIVGTNGNWFSEGKYYPQTQRILLLTENSSGVFHDETWIPFQDSSVASPSSPTSTPAPSSTTNVYVQPNTPAQSAPAPTPSTPILRPGTYACSGTNVTMELTTPLLFVHLYSGNKIVGNGSYNISGKTITITIAQADDVIKHMRGITYAYTIMSDTSFSGSGETWYRR